MKNLQHKEHKHKLKMLTPIHQQNHFQSLQSIVMGDSLLEKKKINKNRIIHGYKTLPVHM